MGDLLSVKECSVNLEWRGSAAVIAVAGEVDTTSAPFLETAVAECLSRKPAAVIIDLAETEFIGSAGISVLMSACTQAGDSGVGFGVAADSPATSRILNLLCLGDALNLHPDVATTLAALRK